MHAIDGRLTRGPEQFTGDPDQAERTLGHLATMDWHRIVFSHGAEVANPADALRRLVAEGD